jgi:protein-S-isoprenylcysteine O-methyltransferase Ste14
MASPAWVQHTPASVAFWLAYAACFVPEIIGSFFQKSGSGDRKKDRGSVAILIGGTIASLFIAFNLAINLPALTGAKNGVGMMIAGTALMVAGVSFRWYAIRTLGRFFTRDVAIRDNHRIIRTGPYRILRHPSYSGYLIAMAGIGIALNNWAALLIMLTINVAIYNHRMSIEEAALADAFGPDYEQYKRETKRIIPLLY